MNPTLAPVEFVRWRSRDGTQALACTAAVLQQLRAAAVEGLNRVGHGGVEVGGVLYGLREGGGVRVLAAHPVPCEYAFGPTFVLSDADTHAFREALEAPSREPSLAGLQVVGWFHSHTRMATDLTARDLEFHRAHFPAAWQVAMVLRPSNFGPTVAGIFFVERAAVEGDGAALEIPAERARAPEPAAAESVPEPALETAAPETVSAAGPPAPPAAAPAQRRRWLAAAAAVSLLVAVAAVWNHREASVALHVADTAGQLRIQWDRSAPAVRRARSGRLDIQDGASRVQIALGPDQLRNGDVVYERRAGSVLVRLVLERQGARPLETVIQYVGEAPAPARAAELVSARAAERVSTPVPAAAAAIEMRAAHPPRPKPDDDTEPRPSTRRFAPPAPRAASVGESVGALPRPPDIAAGPGLPHRTALFPEPAPAAPPPKAAASQPAPVRQVAARTGAVLWTGSLRRSSVVTIEGPNASTGYLNGSLPAVPVRVTVMPARFSPQGLLVFSTAPPRAVEPPSAANGWNRTNYVSSSELARSITVLEAPGPQNGWGRLVFRCESRSCEVAMIHWETR